jgi:hypothetical protein
VLEVEVEVVGIHQEELEDIHHLMVKNVMEVVLEEEEELVQLEAGVVEVEVEELLVGVVVELPGAMVIMEQEVVNNGLEEVVEVVPLLDLLVMVLGVEMEKLMVK